MIRLCRIYGTRVAAEHAFQHMDTHFRRERHSLMVFLPHVIEIHFLVVTAYTDLDKLRGSTWDAIEFDDSFNRWAGDKLWHYAKAMAESRTRRVAA